MKFAAHNCTNEKYNQTIIIIKLRNAQTNHMFAEIMQSSSSWKLLHNISIANLAEQADEDWFRWIRGMMSRNFRENWGNFISVEDFNLGENLWFLIWNLGHFRWTRSWGEKRRGESKTNVTWVKSEMWLTSQSSKKRSHFKLSFQFCPHLTNP